MNEKLSLAEFAPVHRRAGVQTSTRVIAGSLTVLLYALLALLALLPPPRAAEITLSKTITILLPDTPHKTMRPPPPPFLAPLIKPPAESVSPPDFAVMPAVPPLRAPLPTFAAVMPPAGDITAGTGAAAGSANGANGDGKASTGCFDAVWAQAVTNHIGHFYRYPSRADGATGIVMMQFTVHRSGWLDGLEVGKSSGNDWLDHVAYEMVRRAQPLPPIPARMHARRVTVELPINFGVDGVTFSASPNTCE